MEGSVRRSGDLLRITVQLNRADSGSHIWSQVYEVRMAEIFATQDKIVAAIERSLNQASSAGKRTARAENLDAWEHLLRARASLMRNAPGALPSAMEELRTALAIDPSFAAAHAEMARAVSNAILVGALHFGEHATLVRFHASESVRLDPYLAVGHASLARALAWSWDWQGAERGARKAVELQPGSELTLTNLAIILADRGRKESIGIARHAMRLNPLYWAAPQHLSRALYLTRNFDESVKAAEEAIRTHRDVVPLWFRNYIAISLAEGAKGNHVRAIEAAELGWSMEQNRMNIGWIGLAGHAYARFGNRDKAHECIRQLEQIDTRQKVAPVYFARIYIGLNDATQAFDWLNRAVDERDPNLTWIDTDPRCDVLRKDARWPPLIKRMGLA